MAYGTKDDFRSGMEQGCSGHAGEGQAVSKIKRFKSNGRQQRDRQHSYQAK
jgi:hypothetical protein